MTQTTSEMLRLRRVISDLMEKVRLSDLTADELRELAALVVSDFGRSAGWLSLAITDGCRLYCGLAADWSN